MRAAEGFAQNQTASETWNGIGPPKRAAHATHFTVLLAAVERYKGAIVPRHGCAEAEITRKVWKT